VQNVCHYLQCFVACYSCPRL